MLQSTSRIAVNIRKALVISLNEFGNTNSDNLELILNVEFNAPVGTPTTLSELSKRTGISEAEIQRMANIQEWEDEGCPQVFMTEAELWANVLEIQKARVKATLALGYKTLRGGTNEFKSLVREILVDRPDLPVVCHRFNGLTGYSFSYIETLIEKANILILGADHPLITGKVKKSKSTNGKVMVKFSSNSSEGLLSPEAIEKIYIKEATKEAKKRARKDVKRVLKNLKK